MKILAINCGSSTVKFAVFDEKLNRAQNGQIEQPANVSVPQILESLAGEMIEAVGHRIVHGGAAFLGPVQITPAIRQEIANLVPLAPQHQPHHIAGIDAVSKALPHAKQFACFDTAFHRTISQHRQEMALPKIFAEQGLLRYGFHGLSYEYICSVFSRPKMIICHLGNGCSLAAVEHGKSVYTSMGFTPLDGLMMGTRSGAMDPGAVLWLIEKLGSIENVRDMLNAKSGLLGVSGISSDMRTLLKSEDPQAHFAIQKFVDCLALEIGKATAALEGLDAIVFTGGIGENAAAIRAKTLYQLAWLGFELDETANAAHAQEITTPQSQRSAHVIKTNEEFTIASAVKRMLNNA